MRIAFEKENLRFYFSFQCPYSYLVWEQLCRLLNNNDQIKINPISIGINPPNNFKFNHIELWNSAHWEKLAKDAEQLGIELKKPQKFVSEAEVACAIKLYGAVGAEAYISSIFKAVFCENLDISVPSSLRYLLQSEGVDSSILIKAFENHHLGENFENLNNIWGSKRIRALPTLESTESRSSGFLNCDDILKEFSIFLSEN